jgi:hypothetical protein
MNFVLASNVRALNFIVLFIRLTLYFNLFLGLSELPKNTSLARVQIKTNLSSFFHYNGNAGMCVDENLKIMIVS